MAPYQIKSSGALFIGVAPIFIVFTISLFTLIPLTPLNAAEKSHIQRLGLAQSDDVPQRDAPV